MWVRDEDGDPINLDLALWLTMTEEEGVWRLRAEFPETMALLAKGTKAEVESVRAAYAAALCDDGAPKSRPSVEQAFTQLRAAQDQFNAAARDHQAEAQRHGHVDPEHKRFLAERGIGKQCGARFEDEDGGMRTCEMHPGHVGAHATVPF